MKNNPKKFYHDFKGADKAIRFRVHLRDKVTFRSAVEAERAISLQGQSVKNPNEADIQKLKHMVNNGSSGSALGDSAEMSQLAHAMIAAGGGMEPDGIVFEGSLGVGGNINSLKALLQESSEDEDKGQEEPKKEKKEKTSGAGGDDDDGASASAGKKHGRGGGSGAGGSTGGKAAEQEEENPIALNDEILKTQRMWRKSVVQLQSNFNEILPQADSLLTEAKTESDNPHIRMAFYMCSGRTRFAKACLSENNSDDLDCLIESAKNAAGEKLPSSDVISPRLGRALEVSVAPESAPAATGAEPAGVPGEQSPKVAKFGYVSFEEFAAQQAGKVATGASDREKEEHDESVKNAWAAFVDEPLVWRLSDDAGVLKLAIKDREADLVAAAAGKPDDVPAPAPAPATPWATPKAESWFVKSEPAPPVGHGVVGVRNLPPCKGFEDLRTFKDLEKMGEELELCISLQQIQEHAKAMQTFRNVLRAMCGSWKASVSELDKAIKGWKAAQEQSVKDAEKKAGKKTGAPPPKRRKGGAAMDVCLEKGTQIVTVDCRIPNWVEQMPTGFDGDADLENFPPLRGFLRRHFFRVGP